MNGFDERERALKALSLSRRHHIPLSESARRVGLIPAAVLEHAREGFEPVGSDWWATRRDRIPREFQILTEGGPEWIVTKDSRLASRLGQQNNAIRRYLNRGDPSRLRPITLRVGTRTVRLASDPATIDRIAEGGEIHLEVYRR